jgi:hypothetical protein
MLPDPNELPSPTELMSEKSAHATLSLLTLETGVLSETSGSRAANAAVRPLSPATAASGSVFFEISRFARSSQFAIIAS